MSSSPNDAQTCITLSEARLDLAPSTPIAYPPTCGHRKLEMRSCLNWCAADARDWPWWASQGEAEGAGGERDMVRAQHPAPPRIANLGQIHLQQLRQQRVFEKDGGPAHRHRPHAEHVVLRLPGGRPMAHGRVAVYGRIVTSSAGGSAAFFNVCVVHEVKKSARHRLGRLGHLRPLHRRGQPPHHQVAAAGLVVAHLDGEQEDGVVAHEQLLVRLQCAPPGLRQRARRHAHPALVPHVECKQAVVRGEEDEPGAAEHRGGVCREERSRGQHHLPPRGRQGLRGGRGCVVKLSARELVRAVVAVQEVRGKDLHGMRRGIHGHALDDAPAAKRR